MQEAIRRPQPAKVQYILVASIKGGHLADFRVRRRREKTQEPDAGDRGPSDSGVALRLTVVSLFALPFDR